MPVRILIFTLQFPPDMGGVESAAWHLSQHLGQAGAETVVLTGTCENAHALDGREKFLVKRVSLGRTGNLIEKIYQKIYLMYQFMRLVLDAKPDLVLCMHWDPCAFIARGALAMLPHSPPYYLVVHGMELMQLPRHRLARWIKGLLRLFALKGARKIIAVSDFTRKVVISLGLAPQQVCVIPNGIPWDGEIREHPQSPKAKSTKILLSISRLVPRKGHDTVLQALPKIAHQVTNVVYKIAGTGPEETRLKHLAQALGVTGHVQFVGVVSEQAKHELLDECDVFILPCRATPTDFEGFGIVFLEAMQHGKPVIAGNSGGVPEVVRDRKTGRLVRPDDPDVLADAVLDLLQNSDAIERMGKNAMIRAHDCYRWEVITERYLTEFESSV